MTAKEEIFREDTLLLHIAVSNNQIEFEIFANNVTRMISLFRWIPKLSLFIILDYSVATLALKNLNGQLLNGRRLSVQPANSNYQPKIDYRKKGIGNKESLKSLSMSDSTSNPQTSKEDKIRAIEAKLKALEKGEVNRSTNCIC